MDILLTTIHVLAALVLVTVVLLQHGKGADIGATFGGGSSQTVFGGRGAGNFLTKMTTLFVVLFMGTSISLAYLSTPSSVFDDIEPPPAPASNAGGTNNPDATPIDGSGSDSDEIPGFEAVPEPDADAQDPAGDAPSAAPRTEEPSGGTSEPGGQAGSGSEAGGGNATGADPAPDGSSPQTRD